MMISPVVRVALLALVALTSAAAQVGRIFPAEKRVLPDPVTGVPLTFLTSTPVGDSKIYQTHPQWTSDGKWLVFRSQRAPGQALAVNEETGVMVQLTERGYVGMLCLAQRTMKLYLMRPVARTTPGEPGAGRGGRTRGPLQVVEVDLGNLLADALAGRLRPGADAYERGCGVTPEGWQADGNMGLDANEDAVYFRVLGPVVAAKFPADQKPADTFGPRGMGAGPNGLAAMNLRTGETRLVTVVGFQIGHVQTNPWVPGEIVFCWETGGKAPQRTWTVMADGSGLRPLYPEADYEWVTHEAVITRDEVAIAIMGHTKVGVKSDWGGAGSREHPGGLGVVNLRTREMRLAGQTKSGSGLWHVAGSADGRWVAGDDFSRSIYLIDRHTNEMVLLTTGHKPTAQDHPHPTFSPDGTRIQIQSAMLSDDGKAMNICIVPVPPSWLARTYDGRLK